MSETKATIEQDLERLLEQETFPPPADFVARANVTEREEVSDHEAFWAEKAGRLDWPEPWEQVLDWSNPPFAKWFVGGKLNVAHKLRRPSRGSGSRRPRRLPLARGGGRAAGRPPTTDLHRDGQRLANALGTTGIGPGDIVGIFHPDDPRGRRGDARLRAHRRPAQRRLRRLLPRGRSRSAWRSPRPRRSSRSTARGARARTAPVKAAVDEVIDGMPSVKTVFVVKATDAEGPDDRGPDVWVHEAMEAADADCPAEPFDSEHPLFLLYSSGSTAAPKGSSTRAAAT
jgi:acetyl-CoA synthetase